MTALTTGPALSPVTGRRWSLGIAGAVALAAVLLMVVAAAWPALLAPGDPDAIDPRAAFTAPGPGHWFGTDESGRDVFTRVIHGTRQSLGIGAAATAIGVSIGLAIGMLAGLGPRILDSALSRVIEVLFSLPSLVLALLLVAVMGTGVTPTLVAVGLATAPGYARILRSQVRSVASSAYVEAARLEGQPALRVFGRHIAPNALWPLVAIATLGVGQAIVWVAALSFLGLGALPPSPEWGAMVNGGRVYLVRAWWLTLAPGLAITLTAAALTVLGRRLGRVVQA
ncbi:ABC transporter permease [Sanguibacter suarezii]|uniref:ABC transporter permease n=1 Tax=Sanguibacter suarezii TaxID=60921 RepID=UPI0008360E2E|nr:ABC transporter permease [Sanguibacter suarezii]